MFRVVGLTPRRLAGLLLGLAILASFLAGFAGAASSTASAGFSARLTETSFTSSQAKSVKLVYRFSKPRGSFSYRLTFKKGSKWQVVKSATILKRTGHFKGSRTATVKKLFGEKPVRVGSYRLRLSTGKSRASLAFTVVKRGKASLAAGGYHSCIRLDSGVVECWGLNGDGQLGDGTTINRGRPVRVRNVSRAVQVSTGIYHTCALLSNHAVKCWGNNRFGQLGDGSTTSRTTPTLVKGLSKAIQINAGNYATCAVLSTHKIKCWGANWDGQLGNGMTPFSSTPLRVKGISTATAVATGGYSYSGGVLDNNPNGNHTCALISGGTVECWGNGSHGELGTGGFERGSPTPVAVTKLSSVVAISAGGNRTCAILSNGTVECWGNVPGFLGDGELHGGSLTPVPVPGVSNATQLSVGERQSCARLSSGAIRCWSSVEESTRVTGIAPVSQVSAGRAHSCALLPDGKVNCWGNNYYGQLGNGQQGHRSIPVGVTGISNAVQLSAGFDHTCSLQSGGEIKCWGANGYGQLGDGTTRSKTAPVYVSGISNAVQISARGNQTCALLVDHTVECWGGGGMSYGVTITRTSPTRIAGISTAVQISVGAFHGCALLSDKTIKCWGNNDSGELGDGTTVDRTTAVTVSGIANAARVSAGGEEDWYSHTCAVLTDGSVECWGANTYGQLGAGTTSFVDVPVPAPVSGISNARNVSAGDAYTCADLLSNEIKCWGGNWHGELGDGTETNRPTPTRVSGIANAVQVSAGGNFYWGPHTCALVGGGFVKCWGDNSYGQIGAGVTNHSDGTFDILKWSDFSSTPISVIGISTARQVSAGGSHSCALLSDNKVKCWGSNDFGQLGADQLVYSKTPVKVIGIP